MATTGARRRANICLLGLIDGRYLRRRSNAQSLDMRSLSARGESRPGHADGVVKGGLICHLSKTASVHAHVVACCLWRRRGSLVCLGYTGVPKEGRGKIVRGE